MKLLEACELYLATGGTYHSDQSRQGMRKVARQLADYCGDRALHAYTTDDLTGFCLGHGGRGTAPNTIKSRLHMLRPFFDWCAWRGHIGKNPATALKFTVKPGNGGVREHTWLTRDDVARFVAGVNLEDLRQHRDLAVFSTTVMLGMRRSEVASLRWPSFRQDLTEVSFVGKGNKFATLPVPATLQHRLDTWRTSQPEGAVPFPSFAWLWNGVGVGELVAQWATPIKAAGVYQIVKRAAVELGVPTLAPHDLRRTLAGILEEQGRSLKEIQEVLRHANLSTTDRYMSKNPGRVRDALEAVKW